MKTKRIGWAIEYEPGRYVTWHGEMWVFLKKYEARDRAELLERDFPDIRIREVFVGEDL